MGTPYTSIPGVGPISSWGSLGKFDLIATLYRIAQFRVAEIPSERPTTIYIAQSVSGSAGGGGGDGSLANPYLVRHMADVSTLWSSIQGTNKAFRFRCGDIFYADQVNSFQGINITVANVTIGSYGVGDAPEILGFASPNYPNLWTFTPDGVLPNVYTVNTGGVAVYYVRGRVLGSSRSTYEDIPWIKCTSAANAKATPYGFYYAAGVVTLNVGSHDPSTLEFATVTGNPGLNAADFDGIRIEGLTSAGWGLDAMGTAGAGQCIRLNPSGTNAQICINCKATFGPYHVTGTFAGIAGGISSWVNMLWGLNGWNSTMIGDANVAFNGLGGQEVVRWNCKQLWGALQLQGSIMLPESAYGHTTTGNPALVVDLDTTINVRSGVQIKTIQGFGNLPVPSDFKDKTQFRLFRHNFTAYGDSLDPSTHIGFFSNEKLYLSPTSQPVNWYEPLGSSGPAFQGVFINPDINIWCDPALTWTSKWLRVFNSTATTKFYMIHSRMRLTGSSPTSGVNSTWGTSVQTCEFWNPVFGNSTGVTWDLTGTTDEFKEADAAGGTGGFSRVAAIGVASTEYDGTPSPVVLAAQPNWTSASGVPVSCKDCPTTLPAGIFCEYDQLMQKRPLVNRSRGPIEGNPVGASTEINRGASRRSRARTCPRP